jgi:inosose dehydratase
MMKTSTIFSRREWLASGAAALLAGPSVGLSDVMTNAIAGRIEAGEPWRGLKIGVASYSLRRLPTETAIAAIRRVGLRYASIKEAHLPFKTTADERRAGAQKFRDAGITPLSCGNITMRNEAELRMYFEYARDAGLPTIVCTPDKKFLPALDRLVKEFDIKLALHNHGPKATFASPYDVMKAVEPYDARLGLCMDVGHTLRAGVDPAEAIVKCRARLYDLHLKDLVSAAENADNAEAGRGVMNFKAIFRALLKINYQHLASIEYEKDADDPIPGLAESVGYLRGIITELSL